MIEVDETKLVEMVENIISDYAHNSSRVLKSIEWYLLELIEHNSFYLSEKDLEKFRAVVFNKISEIKAGNDL